MSARPSYWVDPMLARSSPIAPPFVIDPDVLKALQLQAKQGLSGKLLGIPFLLFFSGWVVCNVWTFANVPSSRREKIMIYTATVFLCSTCCLHSFQAYDIAINHAFSMSAFSASSWVGPLTCLEDGIIIAISQAFFALRLSALQGNRLWIQIGLCILVLVASFPHIAAAHQQITNYTSQDTRYVILTFSLKIAVDCVIGGGTICTLLRKDTRAVPRTREMVQRLAAISIQGMIAPFIASVVGMILLFACPGFTYWNAALSVVDAIAILPMLQSILLRETWRMNPDDSTTIHIPQSDQSTSASGLSSESCLAVQPFFAHSEKKTSTSAPFIHSDSRWLEISNSGGSIETDPTAFTLSTKSTTSEGQKRKKFSDALRFSSGNQHLKQLHLNANGVLIHQSSFSQTSTHNAADLTFPSVPYRTNRTPVNDEEEEIHDIEKGTVSSKRSGI